MSVSAETAIYERLVDVIAALGPSDDLFAVTVHPHVYGRITEPRTIRVSDPEAEIGAGVGNTAAEYNVLLQLQFFARVDNGADPDAHAAAREACRSMVLATAQLILDDPSLDGRVCDTQLLGSQRGWGKVQTTVYAVATLDLLVDAKEA